MAAASTSKPSNSPGIHEYVADSKVGQIVFEQQVLLPLFTRIKHKGCRPSDFLDIKQVLLYIFDSFKYQKRNYLVDIFTKNNVYDLLFERPKPIEKPKEIIRKRPNVIVFKQVPWFCKEKRQRTEALKKTIEDEAKYQRNNQEEDDDSDVIALSPVSNADLSPSPVEIYDRVIKSEEDAAPPSSVISSFDEKCANTELVYINTNVKQEVEESATDNLVKLIVDTYSKEPPSVAAISVKEESVEPIEISSFDVQSSSSYLDAIPDIDSEPFVTVDYDVSPSSKKQRFSKNLEGHNLYFVVAKYYYAYWDIFKDWSNRSAEINRKRAQAWNDIFHQMEKDGFKDFNRESLPLNFRKFVSKLRTKKRNQLSGTCIGSPILFTQEEEEILEYENSYIRLKRKCITIKD